MCPGNLARQIHVVIGDVRLWVPRPVLELYFQTTAELVEIDLRPLNAEFAANPLGHGDTYSLFFCFDRSVLSVVDSPGRSGCLLNPSSQGFNFILNPAPHYFLGKR